MAFPVAVQSAVFYFLACTPCMSARNRHRAKKKFDRERKVRAALEEDEPPLYRHPSPFSVNPYWEEEIRMGPSLPKKGRAARQNTSQRKLTSAGQDSSMATRSSLAISSHGGGGSSSAPVGAAGASVASGGSSAGGGVRNGCATGGDGAEASANRLTAARSADTNTSGGGSRNEPHIAGSGSAGDSANGIGIGVGVSVGAGTGAQPLQAASPTLDHDDARSMSVLEATATATTASIEGWNYKRYQREDEELWGSEPSRTHKLMDAIVKAGSSAGRLLESTLGSKERAAAVTDQARASFYSTTIIHPPVNDYHPPVVSSKPAHKDALRWMLQPPPPAKVMEGKVPVSRSTSVASSVNGNSSTTTAAGAVGRRSATAGSEVSLTRRMAIEARMRRVDSNNSGATVTGRPRATSSTEEVVAAADRGTRTGGGAVQGGGSSPSRSVSRKSPAGGEFRTRSQPRSTYQSRARSRSGSLASSAEDPGWSSDEDGMLRTMWRFPAAAPPAVPAVPAMPAMPAAPAVPAVSATPEMPAKPAKTAKPSSEATPAAAKLSKPAQTAGTGTTPLTQAAGGLLVTSMQTQQPAQTELPGLQKLETIISSDGSSSSPDLGLAKTDKNKENRPMAAVASTSSIAIHSVATSGIQDNSGDGSKAPHDHSAGSSLDSGLALSA